MGVRLLKWIKCKLSMVSFGKQQTKYLSWYWNIRDLYGGFLDDDSYRITGVGLSNLIEMENASGNSVIPDIVWNSVYSKLNSNDGILNAVT